MTKTIFGAAMIAMLAAGSADAALLTYRLNGVFDDGATLTGRFAFDDRGDAFDQFSDVRIAISTLPTAVTSINRVGYNGTGAGIFSIGANNLFEVNFDGTFTRDGALRTVTGTSLYTFSEYQGPDGRHALRSGTIMPLAVPEPATWAMLALGMTMLGVAMRDRRRRSRFV